FGAETISFSPLADEDLPRDVGAIYLTGAFLADYADELSANKGMREAIQAFAQAGGVIYSEGAGTAYLCEEFVTGVDDTLHQGVGLLPARALWEGGSQRYLDAVTLEETVLGRPGLAVKGVMSHEWKISELERILKSLRIGQSEKTIELEGYSPGAQIL